MRGSNCSPLAGTSGGNYRVCSLDRGVLPFSLVIPESFSFLLRKGVSGLSWSFCVKKDVYGTAAQLGGMHGAGFWGECELESSLSGSVQLSRWLISLEKVLPSPLVSGVSVTFEGPCQTASTTFPPIAFLWETCQPSWEDSLLGTQPYPNLLALLENFLRAWSEPSYTL